tara:strand:+ start:75731 stop:76006 length:276 start_codon:yes stop_codon:yes gene_type:complete
MVIGTGHMGTAIWAETAIIMLPARARMARRKSFAERDASASAVHKLSMRGEEVDPTDINNSFHLLIPERAMKKLPYTKRTFAYQLISGLTD